MTTAVGFAWIILSDKMFLSPFPTSSFQYLFIKRLTPERLLDRHNSRAGTHWAYFEIVFFPPVVALQDQTCHTVGYQRWSCPFTSFKSLLFWQHIIVASYMLH